jgi:hypothetical protein
MISVLISVNCVSDCLTTTSPLVFVASVLPCYSASAIASSLRASSSSACFCLSAVAASCLSSSIYALIAGLVILTVIPELAYIMTLSSIPIGASKVRISPTFKNSPGSSFPALALMRVVAVF